MKKKKQKHIPMTNIIRDVRDGSKDYLMPLSEAQEKYQKGLLCFYPDIGQYGEIK